MLLHPTRNYMLVILKEPIKHPETDVLAVNLNRQDTVNIHKADNGFQLIVIQQFDGHLTNQSQLHCPLGAFDTYEECLDLFQKLVNALKTGDQIFDLRDDDQSVDLKNIDKPAI